MSKQRICHLLQNGISFNMGCIEVCCLARGATGEIGHPVIIHDYNGEPIDWDKLFEIKQKQQNLAKESKLPECEGCYALEEREYNSSELQSKNKIRFINFNHWNICNSKCVYCGHSQLTETNVEYPVYDIIKDLIDKNLLDNTGEITFQGGEPTVLPEFEKLIELFLEQKCPIRIHTSAIKYSPAISKGIKAGLVTVIPSIDSGSYLTYKKIKRVDKFNLVCKNIQKYMENISDNNSHLFKLKYIIVPGYNDSLNEIEKWFNLIKKYKIKNIIIDFECNYLYTNNKNVAKHIEILFDYIVYKSKVLKLNLEFYDSAKYYSTVHKKSVSSRLFDFPLLLNLIFNYEKSKIKSQKMNINYPY